MFIIVEIESKANSRTVKTWRVRALVRSLVVNIQPLYVHSALHTFDNRDNVTHLLHLFEHKRIVIVIHACLCIAVCRFPFHVCSLQTHQIYSADIFYQRFYLSYVARLRRHLTLLSIVKHKHVSCECLCLSVSECVYVVEYRSPCNTI